MSPPKPRIVRPIRLMGVRQNNLKNIDVEFPSKKLTVVTGVSGSGKSSLAFDTLYAEGQRRYIESLSTYTRQFLDKMPKPELDKIENVPPAIALEQRNHVVNSRSTVGTQTEIVDFLRIFFAKIGETFCVDCGSRVRRIDAPSTVAFGLQWLVGRKVAICAPIQIPGREGRKELEPATSKKAKKGKIAAKKGKEPAPQFSLETYFQIFREQGFRRLLIQTSKKKLELFDLDEPEALRDLPKGSAYVVLDRTKYSEPVATSDQETRSRLADSVEQAFSLGRGEMAFFDLDSGEQKTFRDEFACESCGRAYRVPEPNLFSFNSPLGACQRCSGFGFTLDVDESLVVPDPSKTLKNGAIDPLSKPSFSEWEKEFFRFVERHGISIGKRYKELSAAEKKLIWNGDPKDSTFPGVLGFFDELAKKKYKLHVRVFIRRYQTQTLCRDCGGTRLSREALNVKVRGRNIAEILNSAIIDLRPWFEKLELTKRELDTVKEPYQQITRRLSLLDRVGVGYLSLTRLAKTLSGGEFQRINLATQLGNGLCGTLYVLDEPSIGLHAADTERLISILKELRDQGNTLVVVEHDLEVMKAADWLVEIGPGAGRRGGECIAQGSAEDLIRQSTSLTGKYLSGEAKIEPFKPIRPPGRQKIRISGCREHNLKDVTVEFPLERFVVVTGVSGSGKSTLIHQTLYPAIHNCFTRDVTEKLETGAFHQLHGVHGTGPHGVEQIQGIVMLDQKPIGKNSRSNPATYLKAWDEIRKIYANLSVSVRRGFTPQYFSFNVDGGRCPVCAGEGEITLDMHFMAEMKLPCEECGGKRFKRQVLDVIYKGKNVADLLLHTTIDEAYELFRENAVLNRKLGILREVGLGYLTLGQSATTLSGGESQRLKIAAALEERAGERLLYIFDEPTTGLHLEDVRKLLRVVQDLVDARHSVIMIEHQLDVIAQADWVIDMGPGGGEFGGNVIAAGPPDHLVENAASITGKMLTQSGYRFPPRESKLTAERGKQI